MAITEDINKLNRDLQGEQKTSNPAKIDHTIVYEIGYSIVPTLPEEEIPNVVDGLKSIIDNSEGVFVSEEFPVLLPLAYTISKVTQNKKHLCNEAYFGWIKFDAESENIIKIKNELDKNENILRYLLVKVPKEGGVNFGKNLIKKMDESENTDETLSENDEVVHDTPASVEEIDKEIDDLIIE